MTRAPALAALQAAEVEAEAYGADNITATQDEWELELLFATDGSERLRQLSLEGEAVLWAGQRLPGMHMDEALRAMNVNGPALWTSDDAAGVAFPDPPAAPAPPVTDEELLAEGTIWLPERGLGLIIYEGVVAGVAWRGPQDLPTQFAGPVTETQRELSRRPDVQEYLRKQAVQRAAAAIPKDPLRFLRTAVNLATIAALALTARDGFKEMQVWMYAPAVKAHLVAIEHGPTKQFLEYLPAPVTRYLPRALLTGKISGPPAQTELYRVEFTDPREQRREALLEQGEFYVPPREIGEELEVLVIDEDPPRVKGPARARDAAFIDHMPWAICIGVSWLIVQFLIGILPTLLRWLWRRIPSRTSADPYRPELQ